MNDSLLSARPEAYTQQYYLTSCGDAARYIRTHGAELGSLHEYAINLAAVRAGMRMLDVGCGRGELVAAGARHGALALGIDFSDAALELARPLTTGQHAAPGHACLSQMDARQLGLLSESFDVVLATDVVEHVTPSELDRLLLECHRILVPGGRLVIHTMPTRNFVAFGQHLWRALCYVRGRPPPPVISHESEARYALHCNIHSRSMLQAALRMFRHRRVWYDFSVHAGVAKALCRVTGLTPLLTRNLWAVAQK